MDGAEESLAARTRRLLAELSFRPRRSRGQSFLIDPSVARRTAEAACRDEAPQVLEIGAGLGALTGALAERAAQVVAIDIQPEFVTALRELFAGHANLRLVEADVLAVDLSQLLSGSADGWYVAGNLPYYAASAIILRLLETWPPFRRIVAMVQREVGERLLARPGDGQYGSLSVVVRYYVNSGESLFRVPRGALLPQPKVESVVVELQPRQAPRTDVADTQLLFAIIRDGFGHRRKQLVTTLTASTRIGPTSRELFVEAMDRAGIAERVRAEELGLDSFIALANALADSGVVASGSS